MTTVKDETLVYDQERSQIHHLNATVAALWSRCDGAHSLDDLVIATGLDPVLVAEGLDQLATANLLTVLPSRQQRNRHTRRRLLRGAVAGGIALPAVVSLTAPASAQSQLDCNGIEDIVLSCPLENNGRCCRDDSGCVGVCGDTICNALWNGCI